MTSTSIGLDLTATTRAQMVGLHIASAGNRREERTDGPRHLWRKLAEQITRREESEAKRRSLARVGNVVKAGGKIGVAHKSTRRGSHKIRQTAPGMATDR